jgi:transcriptional regulator with GAF, ATPase, and Fis domain
MSFDTLSPQAVRSPDLSPLRDISRFSYDSVHETAKVIREIGGNMSNCLSNEELRRQFCELGFVTVSEMMIPVLQQAHKSACVSDITVLIEGETGTGKQVLANAIHLLDDKRKCFPFVTVHCSTISESLAESELFGHTRGAFSGAVSERKGLFQTANNGTLFLDDVNDLPPTLQPKLLDCLQRGVIRPVGSDREMSVDVRIIAACNKPLMPLVLENRFRADLYHRLNVVKLVLPPLRKRPQDLPALVLACAQRHARIYPHIREIELPLVEFLQQQPFPGNVRELEHAVERALFEKLEGNSLTLADWVVQHPTDRSEPHDWICEAADSLSNAIFQSGLPYEQAIRQIEGKILEFVVARGDLTRRQIATLLQTSERTLYHKLRSHGIRHQAVAAAAKRTVA